MDKNSDKLKQNYRLINPPGGLLEKVLSRLEKEQKILALKRRRIIFSFGAVISALGLIPAYLALQASLAESGFFQFFSLIFSDSEIIAAYWQNFVLSLLESLPIINLAIFLAVIMAFLEFLKLLTKNLKFISRPNNYHLNIWI